MTLRKGSLALLIAAALAPLAVQAQYSYPPAAPAPVQSPQRTFSQAELDQMLAPIALYPDPLLSQVLMAATYPIEVVEAARWTRANPGLQGDAAVRAVQNQDWDPSVKSLVAFPQVLQRMDEQLSWTESLGDAFLGQASAVMDSVQQLRQRAEAAGNLRSTQQIRVERQGPTILVEPATPDIVYVPYYDPLVVYGTWWWPAYRPVYWAPWPGYARAPGFSAGLWFGRPSGVSLSFFFGDFDWGRRAVRVVRPTAYYYRPPHVVVSNFADGRFVAADHSHWQHDPAHRRGANYRAPDVRQRFSTAQTEQRATQPAVRQAAPPAARPERREARPEQPRQREQAQATERAQHPQPRAQAQPQHQERAQQQRAEPQRQERAQRQDRREHQEQRSEQHGEREHKGGNG